MVSCAESDNKLFLRPTERRWQPVRSTTDVMPRGSVAPFAHGVHADAVLLGQLPIGAAGLLQCQAGDRHRGRVLAQTDQQDSALAAVHHGARTTRNTSRPKSKGLFLSSQSSRDPVYSSWRSMRICLHATIQTCKQTS